MDRYEQDQLARGEYNADACRVLDNHHQARDENPDDVTGVCDICGFADGWRADPVGQPARFLHYTLSSVAEVTEALKNL